MTSGDLAFMIARTAPIFGLTPRDLHGRALMIRAGLGAPEAIAAIRAAAPGSTLALTLKDRPQMIGAFSWPFMCAAWSPAERWERIAEHCACVDAMAPIWRCRIGERVILAEFSDFEPGLAVILDRPKWFMREGLLTLNMFLGDFRAFSLSFAFRREKDGALVAYVGAIQGRNRDDILDTYRRLTKSLHGLRPRDFLFEAFRILCRRANVVRIEAVADAYRHHRHAYFNSEKVDYTTNYDEVWEDRGGRKLNETVYELDVAPERRDLADVKPNKRSMYRKRFEFLDLVEARIAEGLDTRSPTPFAGGDL